MACLFIVFMTLKTSIQNISKRSHMICSNFAIIEATKVGYKNASYLKWSQIKTPGTEKDKDR